MRSDGAVGKPGHENKAGTSTRKTAQGPGSVIQLLYLLCLRTACILFPHMVALSLKMAVLSSNFKTTSGGRVEVEEPEWVED